jgi:hypothetical protein
MKRILNTVVAASLVTSPAAANQAKVNHVSHKPFNIAEIQPLKIQERKPFSTEGLEPEEVVEEAVIETGDSGVEVFTEETSNYQIAWDGQKLSPQTGAVYGPSGKETYYNLDMSGVVSIARNQGIEGDYWVREDGAKMYGSYIICACGFDVRPRGTLVETSLGTGICLDTGGFAYTDPYQVDLAVTW